MSSGRFNKVHPEERRIAIVTAVLDQGVAQRKAIRMAAAGELEGCGPFKVSNGTVCNWVAAERRARLPDIGEAVKEGRYEAAVDAARLRLSTVVEQELKRLERDARKGEVDTRRIERLASAASRVASMQASPNRNGKGTADQDSENAEGSSPLVATLSSAASTSTAQPADGEMGRSTAARTQSAELQP